MAKVKITGHASGSGVFTITAPNSNTDRTITLPDASVTLGTDATKLPLAGGALTGALTTNSTIDGRDVAADGVLATNALPKGGGTMTGTLNVSESGHNAEIKVGTQTANVHQGYSGVQFEDRGYIGGYPNDSLGVFYNTYHSSGSKAIETGTACNVQLLNGGIRFQTAASVSADAAQSLTDRLEITTDGRGLSQFTAKAWVNFNGENTPAIRDSHNVSSITDVSVGKQKTNFANQMTNDKYVMAGSCNWRQTICGNDYDINYIETISGTFGGADAGADDTAFVHLVIFGD